MKYNWPIRDQEGHWKWRITGTHQGWMPLIFKRQNRGKSIVIWVFFIFVFVYHLYLKSSTMALRAVWSSWYFGCICVCICVPSLIGFIWNVRRWLCGQSGAVDLCECRPRRARRAADAPRWNCFENLAFVFICPQFFTKKIAYSDKPGRAGYM